MRDIRLFVYPWDIAKVGASEFKHEVEELGVNRLAIAVSYHSASIIEPRSRHVLTHVRDSAWYLNDLVPKTPVAGHAANPRGISKRVLRELIGGAKDPEIALDAWFVALHNSVLAEQRPELCIENFAGTLYPFALCPANPASRQYVESRVRDILDFGVFERVILESLCFTPFEHGHVHELLSFVPDVEIRFLFSLCFCSSCRDLASSRGLDVARLKNWVNERVRFAINSPLNGYRRNCDSVGLVSSLLENRDLFEFAVLRSQSVSELLRGVVDTIHAAGAKAEVCAPVFAGSSALGFLEGAEVLRWLELADIYLSCCYFDTLSEVGQELDFLRDRCGGAWSLGEKVGVAFELWPRRHQAEEGLLSKVRMALDVGVHSFSFYNYATATTSSLGWIRSVAQL